VKLFRYKKNLYPQLIKGGNATKYITPFAKEFCDGEGLDIGGLESCTFPNATPINITINDKYHALKLPSKKYDFIFSSHCLEHINEPISKVLSYWKTRLKKNGTLFLYLPHNDMEYWHPNNNKKHKHNIFEEDIVIILKSIGYKDIVCSKRDLYWSFSVIGFNK